MGTPESVGYGIVEPEAIVVALMQVNAMLWGHDTCTWRPAVPGKVVLLVLASQHLRRGPKCRQAEEG